MAHITPRKPFDWWGTLERGLWTGVQAPAGVYIADQVVAGSEIPGAAYWIVAGATIGISIVKTLAQERLRFLDTRTRRR